MSKINESSYRWDNEGNCTEIRFDRYNGDEYHDRPELKRNPETGEFEDFVAAWKAGLIDNTPDNMQKYLQASDDKKVKEIASYPSLDTPELEKLLRQHRNNPYKRIHKDYVDALEKELAKRNENAPVKITEGDIMKMAYETITRILNEGTLGFGYDTFKTGQGMKSAPFNQNDELVISINKNDFPDEMNGGEELEQKIFQLGGKIEYDAMGEAFRITGEENALDDIAELLETYNVNYEG